MLSDDEIIALIAAADTEYDAGEGGAIWPILFARHVQRAAYERAAKECIETAAELRRCADGCTDGRYDWKADGALDCADAISALGRQHEHQ